MDSQMSVPPAGRWVWNDESQTVDFVSCTPADEGVLKKRRQTDGQLNDLQQRSEWLAEVCTLNHRGHQNIRKSLTAAQLRDYRSSLMKRQGDHVTLDDVKRVAVSLLQENYSLPIPLCFMALLKSKELDHVLTAHLLYLSCYFEHKSLENKPKPLMVLEINTEHQLMAKTLAKKEMAQKQLAVCYFGLIMDLDAAQRTQLHHTAHHKVKKSKNMTEWLLHACLYSFLCYVAWVTFGRNDMMDIQEEVGRLLYSDTFNMAVRKRSDDHDSVKTEAVDPEKTHCNGMFKQRVFQRHPALSSIVNQCSPLLLSLLPSPKHQSPHLFLSSPARRLSLVQPDRCDSEALTEELKQQLATISFGILGKPLKQFSFSTLRPRGEQKTNRDEDDEPENDC
ncbi:protein phosphatase 1 regulatory subunit 36 [Aulostomus maculatus]